MKKTIGLLAVLTALGACDMGSMNRTAPAAPASVTPDDCAIDVPNRPAPSRCEPE